MVSFEIILSQIDNSGIAKKSIGFSDFYAIPPACSSGFILKILRKRASGMLPVIPARIHSESPPENTLTTRSAIQAIRPQIPSAFSQEVF